MKKLIHTKHSMESTAKLLRNCLVHLGQCGDSEMGFRKNCRISFFPVEPSNLFNRVIDKKPLDSQNIVVCESQ